MIRGGLLNNLSSPPRTFFQRTFVRGGFHSKLRQTRRGVVWYKKSRHFQLTEKEYNKERKEGVQKWRRNRGNMRRSTRCRQ